MTMASTEQCGQFTGVQKDVLVHIPLLCANLVALHLFWMIRFIIVEGR